MPKSALRQKEKQCQSNKELPLKEEETESTLSKK